NGTVGVDTFNVTGSPSGTTTLDGLGSGDTYNITQSALGGPLTVSDSGGAGTDILTSTTNFAGPETIRVTNNQVTPSGGEPTITYSGIENLNVNGTAGDDTFNVTGSPSGTTTLDGLGSGDTYNITQSALGGPLSITDSGGAGTDILTSTTNFAG